MELDEYENESCYNDYDEYLQELTEKCLRIKEYNNEDYELM